MAFLWWLVHLSSSWKCEKLIKTEIEEQISPRGHGSLSKDSRTPPPDDSGERVWFTFSLQSSKWVCNWTHALLGGIPFNVWDEACAGAFREQTVAASQGKFSRSRTWGRYLCKALIGGMLSWETCKALGKPIENEESKVRKAVASGEVWLQPDARRASGEWILHQQSAPSWGKNLRPLFTCQSVKDYRERCK